jgi:ketosteroid isomerase-like protein
MRSSRAAGEQDVDDVQSPVLQVLEAYKRAVYERDVDAFMRLYEPDARVFDTWGVWSYERSSARRKAIEHWFSSLGSDRVQVTFTEVAVTSASDLAVLSATGTYAALSAEGAPLRSMQNRLTWALRRNAAGWAVVHEHTSTPIDPSDTKAIFRRDPAA